jgi:hypothetical protein
MFDGPPVIALHYLNQVQAYSGHGLKQTGAEVDAPNTSGGGCREENIAVRLRYDRRHLVPSIAASLTWPQKNNARRLVHLPESGCAREAADGSH